MNIDTYQSKLKDSISYFVSIGMSMNHAYSQLWPSEQGAIMFTLLMAARRLSKQIERAQSLQDMMIPDVTGLNLVDTRGELLSLMSYLEQGDCDLDISYSFNHSTSLIFDPTEIIEEENLDRLFPDKEQTDGYMKARKLFITTAGDHFEELQECLGLIVERLEKLIADSKKLKRDPILRMARMEAMEKYYLKRLWPQDKERLRIRIEGELKDEDNNGLTEVQIIQAMIKDLEADNEHNCNNKTLKQINQIKNQREEVAKVAAENRDHLSYDDLMNHLQYRESIKLLSARIEAIGLLAPCYAYQGKLFTNNAAYELARLLGKAFYNYVGFDKKVKSAFIYAAMMNVGMIMKGENNARLMADFINNEWLDEKDDVVKDDDITKPLRKCSGHPFCTIDEDNLRMFTQKEFERYRDLYWRAYSIINKVLVVVDRAEKAPYLDEIHPAIDQIDVLSYLNDDLKSRINYLNSDVGLKWG